MPRTDRLLGHETLALKCNSPGQTRLGDPRQDKELWVVQSKLDWEAARAPAPEGIKCGEGFASGSWEGGLRLPAPRFCQDLKPRLRGLGAFPGGTAPLGPNPGSHSTSGLAFPRLGDTLGDLSLSPLIACLSVAKQLGWEVQSVLGVGLSSASPSPQERPRAALRRVSFHVCKMA